MSDSLKVSDIKFLDCKQLDSLQFERFFNKMSPFLSHCLKSVKMDNVLLNKKSAEKILSDAGYTVEVDDNWLLYGF